VTSSTPTRSRVPPAFESLAYLYGPEDPTHGLRIVTADDRWNRPPDPGPDVDVVLWGRLALNARPSPGSIAYALRREAALGRVRLRPPSGTRLAELHRLPPYARPGRVRRAIRAVALGGLLAEFVRGDRPTRVIDAVASAAGAGSIGRRLRPSGDGSALARLTLGDGTPAELRVSRAGHPKDPARGRAALLALAQADVALVPRPLGGGTVAGADWATESVAIGDHVHVLSDGLLDDVTRFLAALPAAPHPSTAINDHLAEVSTFFPEHAAALRDVAEAARGWAEPLTPVLVHGDMWLNNLFVTDGRLSGVFDWDTWHPRGLPGTDLLNLLAAETRTQQRRDIGPLLIDDYWRSAEVVDALRPYFEQRGLPFPDAAGLAAIGVGWWSSRMYASLHRAHRQIDDPAWARRNLVDALARIDLLRRELG
jgi:hypothetical protein